MKKLKILELTNFSAGGCGVFARVKQEALELEKLGHKVKIFSSNFEKGTMKIVPDTENIAGIDISRFSGKMLGGESFMHWFGKKTERQAIEFSPDVIIAHSYRHHHTLKALELGKQLGCKVFLVTHAPFGRSQSRSPLANLSVIFYDLFNAKYLKQFDKVIAITNWEMPYLKNLGVPESKIAYIPNGIKEEFFTKTRQKKSAKIIYTGRIAPIKNLQVLIKAISLMNNKSANLEIYGPAEKDYLASLNNLISENNLSSKVKITDKTYSSKEQIKELDSASIFVLPSLSEGMPQVLVEAMARGLVVVASDNEAAKDLVEHGKNGFLFQNGSDIDLAARLNSILFAKPDTVSKIRKQARKFSEQFRWSKIAKKLEKVISP